MSKLIDRYKKTSLNEASAGNAISDVKSEFYKAGVKAFNKGLYQRDNPYTDSKEKSEWDAGWTFTMQKQGTSSGKKLNEASEYEIKTADNWNNSEQLRNKYLTDDYLKKTYGNLKWDELPSTVQKYILSGSDILNESYEKGSFKGKYRFLNGLDDYQIRELCMLSKTENESANRTRYDKSVFEGEIDVFADTGDFGINFYTKFTEEQKEDLINCIEMYAKQNNLNEDSASSKKNFLDYFQVLPSDYKNFGKFLFDGSDDVSELHKTLGGNSTNEQGTKNIYLASLNEADGDPLAEGDAVKILKEGDLKGKTGKVISIADKDEAIKKYVIEIDGKEENMQTGDFYNISESKKLFEASPSDAGEIWNKMSDEQKTAWYNKKGIPKLMQDLGDYQNLGQNLMIAIFNGMDSLSESNNLFESKESLTKGDLSRVLSLNAVNGKKFSESDISDDILSTFNSKWSQIYKTNPDFDPFGLDVEPNEVDVFDDFMDLIASLGNSDPKVSLFESKQKLESKKLSVLSKTYESNYLKLNSKAGRDFINLNENLKNVKNKIKNSETITGQKAKFSGTDKNILPF